MIRILFAFVVLIHGAIHLLGFVKAFNLAEVNQLTQSISKPAGLAWLFSALLFVVSAAVFLLNKEWWWIIAAPAIILSQLLIILSWQDAKFGTIANAIILVVTVIGFGIWSFNSMARSELRLLLASASSEHTVVKGEMLSGLPPVVQKWLQSSNVVGKEVVRTLHLKQRGEMRNAPDGNWLSFEAEQWFTTEQPGFIWLADVAAAPGIHISGRDKYEGGRGHMLIKLLSLFPVADARGKEADQGTLLRYLAEIAWFPSAALNDFVHWEEVDSTTAKATMSYGGITASGFYKFNEHGDVLSFEARRYYYREGGATLEDWLIQTDPNGFKEFEGVRIPAKSTVTWKLEQGDFTWLRLEITDLQYNKISF